MLYLDVPSIELYDEVSMEFKIEPSVRLQMEHSLVSLSKWESKWHKPFLSDKYPKTLEETIDYFKCMTMTQNVKPEVYNRFNQETIQTIEDYISNPMTATWFNETHTPPNREILTAEILYYDMIALNIPFECQKWHLNRLITLIKVCQIRSNPSKKMSKAEALNQQRKLNAQRRSQLNSKG